jgi:hypothetical protein
LIVAGLVGGSVGLMISYLLNKDKINV